MVFPRRYVTPDDQAARRPVHVVWEITLACDLKCSHCGSRAGRPRQNELSTAECLDLVRRIGALGTRHVTLIGGEAYLRRDWLEIVRAIRSEGMDCTLQSGAFHLSGERIDAAAAAGLQGVGVSVDGLAPLHDRLRGVAGSFEAAFSALRYARDRGLSISANTQITALILPDLRELFTRFVDTGVQHWQVQLTVAMGRAADHPELLLQPYQLLDLMPLLAELYEEGIARGLLLQPGNNIGYFGPYEALWRGSGHEGVYWTGCNAGQTGLGIEADGTIKGCPSLPTDSYGGGSIRDTPLETIWSSSPRINFRSERSDLWGFCQGCYYAAVCEGGCTWTSHSLLGRPGNNPYCHHRAIELERLGMRERIVKAEPAPGRSFDHGRFDLVLETLSGGDAAYPTSLGESRSLRRGGRPHGYMALTPCGGCRRHVFRGTKRCPHCGGDIKTLGASRRKNIRRARAIYAKLARLVGKRSNASLAKFGP